MADYGKKQDSPTGERDPRWKRIMNLPDWEELWVPTTGFSFKRRDIAHEVYSDGMQNLVHDLKVNGSVELISVAHVRRKGEYGKCSI